MEDGRGMMAMDICKEFDCYACFTDFWGTNDCEWLAEHMRFMNSNPGKGELQQAACRCLQNRIEQNPSICNLIGEENIPLLPIHLSVLAALNIHKDDIYVFHAACTTISLMAFNSKILQNCLVTKGAYVSIIAEMRKWSTEIDILWPACQALRALSFQNITFEEMLVDYDILSILEYILRYICDTDVLKECIGLITCLTNDLGNAMQKCVENNIPQVIMSIASNNDAPEDLVTIAFEAIAIFFTSDDHLLKMKYIITIGKLMDKHETSNRIQVLGCIIMQLIPRETGFLSNPDMLTQMMMVIVQAMARFPNHTCVQMEGCVAIHLFTRHNEEPLLSTQQISSETRIYEPLFYIIETCSTEDDVTLLALQTIQSLATNDKIKNMLLQKASCCGFLKCVEYMILIGADVNASNGQSYPLMNAVSNDDPKLVQLLLRHNASDTKPALQLSLEQENWNIAAILLCHIGYEANSRIINWKDMNIGQLHPKLLLPIISSSDLDEHETSAAPPSPIDHLRCYRQRSRSYSFGDSMDIRDDEKQSKRSITTINEMIPTGREMETMSLSRMPYSSLDPRLHRDNPQKKYTSINSSLNEVECADQPCPPTSTFSSVLQPNTDRCLTPLIVMKDREEAHQSSLKSPQPKTGLYRSRSHMSISSSISNIHNISLSSSLNSLGRVAPVEVFCIPPAKQETERQRQQQRSSTFIAPTFDVLIDNIKLLDISYNNITDLRILTSHPEYDITQFLQHLEKLDLSNNKLFGIPASLCNCLANLTTLNVSDNYLQNFPSEIMIHQKLESLNISGNKIIYIEHRTVTPTCSLLRIDLSRNELRQFPSWMSNIFPRLNKLLLSRNKISSITSLSNEFNLLKELHVSHNSIHTIDDTLFVNCVRLQKIDLSYNQLRILPNYRPKVSEISRLSHINLSHNNIEGNNTFHMPVFLLSIPSLEIIDMSYNRITQLPQPQNWSSKHLIELIFSHNQISNLNFSKNVGAMLPSLQRLNLSYNRLDCIPPEIGLLTSLSALDVSHNQITVLPDEIGRLSNLCHLPLNGLRLCHHKAVLKGTARDIVSYFRSKLKNAISYRRIKLMLVGPTGRGKTSLVRSLATIPHPAYNVSTVGIEVNNWILRPPNKLKKSLCFTMNTWDFAGQEDFYSTHQYFLSSRALYLAVYDLSRGTVDSNKDMEMLTPWLLSIKAAVPEAIVGIVGTHADKIPSAVRRNYLRTCDAQLDEYIQNPGFPAIKFKAFVDNTMSGKRSMECLRDIIYETISGFIYEGQPITEQLVPESYVDLEDMIREEARISSSENRLPIRTKKQLWQRTLENGILLNREEFNRATKFLNDTGSLLHFNDLGCNLHDIYFIDPPWLCEMMARVVTIKEVNPFITPQGILSKTDSLKLFPDAACYPKDFFDQYFKLLRKFEVVLPISDDKYLVTSKLPESPPFNLKLIHDELLKLPDIVVRRYLFPYIPNGFWARLITRMILYCDSLKISEKVEPSEYKYWRSGMFTKWSTERYFLVCALPGTTNEFDIITIGTRIGYMLLGSIVDIVDNLIEEWYPGLQDPLSRHIVRRLCPCYNCITQQYSHYFHLEDCIMASYEVETIECPNCGPVLVKVIAPDVVFGDMESDFVYDDIPVSGLGNEIGKGGFSRVYKANVEGVDLAIKIFGDIEGENPNRLLRQEVDILRRLHHPSLISVVGVNLRPRMLLLEYAPLGNLEATLASDLDLTKGIQHRIAIQIAEGLEYLHDKQIVYRDLKPSNVLVFSLSKEELINVKLSDYGISQIATSLGLTASKGTLGYQAPEVARGDNEYNVEVDIFSFGATLYEIITGGKKPFGEIPSQFEFDKAVVSNKPIKSIISHGFAPWPDTEILVRRCLSANPELRPCANEIRSVLLTVDLPCLKNEVAICKGQSVECIVIRQLQNSQTEMEIWVGSGASGARSQLSWFSTGGKKQSIQGMMIQGRILCMVSFRHFIIIGTNEGFLHVYDAYQKKHSHTLTGLDDSILCLTLVSRDLTIVAGLANGTIAVYNADDLVSEDTLPSFVDVNKLMNNDTQREPITCITLTRDHILCGYGAYVCKIRLDDYTLRSSWQVSPILRSVVYSIIISKNNTFTCCKNSSVISVWDSDKSEAVCKIDCYEILKQNGYVVSKKSSRVLCIQIVDQNILWVGCDSGHIIVIDTLRSNPQMLHIIWRYTASVRVITVTTGTSSSSSCVVTGGMGFKQLFNSNHEDVDHFGGVLLWEADVAKQKKQLEMERKRREELAIQMSQDA